MQVINFQQYKDKKELEAVYQKKCIRLMDELKKEEEREEFDLKFLELVDLFMTKYYPDYYWKFDIFLNEIQKKK